MVQRKASSNLALQPHNNPPKIETNRGSDLKKTMKKSGKSTPNYMKPTTSSDARRARSQSPVSTSGNSSILRGKGLDSLKNGGSCGKKGAKTLLGRSLTKSRSFKASRVAPRRCSTTVLCKNLDAKRATCSSTLKDCKFPAFLRLKKGGTESEGTSAVKICPYTYCSLNGHHLHPPLPPLKSFLSARRLMIKTQRSVKIGCLSPRRREKPVVDDALNEEDADFFVEIYSKKDQEQGVVEQLSDGTICDDSEERELGLLNEDVCFDHLDDSKASDESVFLDYEYRPAKDVEPDPGAGENRVTNDEIEVYSDGKGCGFDEVSQESYDEHMNSDAYSSSDDGEHLEEYPESVNDDDSKEPVSEGFPLDSTERDDLVLGKDKNTLDRLPKKGDEEGSFDPRGPNFLPLETELDGEKVDLRHQDLDERKNSEEWMVDFALRQVVTKLGPARKKKVELLVEAFEKVMPPTKYDLHLMRGSGFDEVRAMQACI